MKFIVEREDIQQAVVAVQRATATRVIQPILSNILIESIEGNQENPENQLKLSATDLDFSIETVIPATIEVPGKTTLSAKKLSEILSKLSSSHTVLFDIDDATAMARIQSGAALFDIRTLAADDFPTIRAIDEQQFIEVSGKALFQAIHQTAFAAASYDTNNVLGGVFFQLNDQGLEMAATDGSRLARRIEASQGAYQPGTAVSAIIPAKTLQELMRLASGDIGEQSVRIAIAEGQISFRTPRFYVVSRLLDGQYPQYNQLIPSENKIVARANRKTFIESLERTAVMANERTNIVRLSFVDGSMSLVAQTPDVGDSQDMMAVDYQGEPFHIAFNYKYVIDALKVIESDDIRMETNGPLSPTLFKSGKENNYLCLVMPVQVK